MFSSLKLGAKIAIGFGMVLLITVILGGVAVMSMNRVKTQATYLSEEYVPEVEILTNLQKNWLEAMFELRGYNYTGDEQFLTTGREDIAAAEAEIEKAHKLSESSSQLKALEANLEEIEKSLGEYTSLLAKTETETEIIAEARAKADPAAGAFITECESYLKSQNESMTREIETSSTADQLTERLLKINLINDVLDAGNSVRIANWRGQAIRDLKSVRESLTAFGVIDAKIGELRKVTRLDADNKALDVVQANANMYRTSIETILVSWEKNDALGMERVKQAEVAMKIIDETTVKGIEGTVGVADAATTHMSRAVKQLGVGLVLSVVIGILLATYLIRNITRPIHKVITGMTQGSEQVASASGQVAQSSQQMAEGASQQASSLEEISASLEELTSMTRQNSDNAQQSNSMATESRTAAERGNASVKRMGEVIKSIKASSDETAKIVKTIDEIAFQTNLLALNAAVEAARAGEAGKGFAVVAEEVRNLAQRSADAARNTSELIEGAQRNADNGVQAAGDVEKILGEIVDSIGKVAQLIAEVSAASNEQSKGIDQINTAISQMDKVTQSNAANAEESASASEELSAQALELREMVNVLMSIVNGAHEGTAASTPSHAVHTVHSAPRTQSMKAPARAGQPSEPWNHHHGNGSSNGRGMQAVAATSARSKTPDEVIPLDDEDFRNF